MKIEIRIHLRFRELGCRIPAIIRPSKPFIMRLASIWMANDFL